MVLAKNQDRIWRPLYRPSKQLAFRMNCQQLFNSIGFRCLDRGNGIYRVITPLSFADGELIGMYVVQHGDSIRISDNADTIFHCRNTGIDISDRKKWRWISNIISDFGMELRGSGEITHSGKLLSAPSLVASYISALVRVADAEREASGMPEAISNFVVEVESYLRLWKPNYSISTSPSIKGHSGKNHKFDLLFGDELVDAVRPHSNSTGSVLRKSLDILNTPTAPSIMVVIDDREDVERAKEETDILASVVKVLPFTHLAHNLAGAPRPLH